MSWHSFSCFFSPIMIQLVYKRSNVPSRFLLESTHIGPQKLVNHVPKAPICVGLVVIKCPVFTKLRTVAHNIPSKPAKNRNRPEDTLRHGRLRWESFTQWSKLGPTHRRNVCHELGFWFRLLGLRLGRLGWLSLVYSSGKGLFNTGCRR